MCVSIWAKSWLECWLWAAPLIHRFLLFRVIRVNGKPEKSEHKQLQPASPVSHKQPSHGRWAPQPLTLIRPPPWQTSERIPRSLLFPRAPPPSLLLDCSEPTTGPERKSTRTKKVQALQNEFLLPQRCSWYRPIRSLPGLENISLRVVVSFCGFHSNIPTCHGGFKHTCFKSTLSNTNFIRIYKYSLSRYRIHQWNTLMMWELIFTVRLICSFQVIFAFRQIIWFHSLKTQRDEFTLCFYFILMTWYNVLESCVVTSKLYSCILRGKE